MRQNWRRKDSENTVRDLKKGVSKITEQKGERGDETRRKTTSLTARETG